MTRPRLILAIAAIAALLANGTRCAAQQELTILTDADSTVREICRWNPDEGETEAVCDEPRSDDVIIDFVPNDPNNSGWSDDPRYLRVHDQNAMDVAYLHFDLSGVAANAQVTNARFQLDAQSNSWGDTSVSVVAIVNENEDWDLNAVPEAEIYGGNAPKLDWSDWEEDLTANSNRFNTPTPFIDEGSSKADEVRQLVDEGDPVFVPSTDIDTLEESNSYGGYACCDGPGTGGSSDGGNNPWPIKDAVDIDVTSLIQWKLGQNAEYSDFTAADRDLTLMVRTEFPVAGGGNGFIRFLARESPYVGGELDLQPGRLVLTVEGGVLVGDFNQSGALDAPDIDDLTGQSAVGTNPAAYDLNADALVNDADVNVWIKDLFNSWVGDADLNGEFNSGDLVQVLASGTYEADVASVWSNGDFNGDGRTNSTDLVSALADGGYELGPRAAVAAVPEPAAVILVLIGAGLVLVRRRRV